MCDIPVSLRYVLVYSINSQKSFEVVQVIAGRFYFEDISLMQVLYDKIADLVGNPRVPVVLVGNKKDLEVKFGSQYKKLIGWFLISFFLNNFELLLAWGWIIRKKRKKGKTRFIQYNIIIALRHTYSYQSERAVSLEQGENLAKQINAVFLETSAKDNLCVNDLFQVSIQI